MVVSIGAVAIVTIVLENNALLQTQKVMCHKLVARERIVPEHIHECVWIKYNYVLVYYILLYMSLLLTRRGRVHPKRVILHTGGARY